MPSSGDGKGSFQPEKGDDRTYNYEVESWVRDKDWPDRRKEIVTGDLYAVDFMVIKVWPEDNPDDVSYDTVWGPMEDWDFVEGYLAYDFGEDGSLYRLSAA